MASISGNFAVGGYFVLDTWGNIRRDTLQLRRSEADKWYYGDTEVAFLEAGDLPAEEDQGGWNYQVPVEGGGVKTIHRPERENRDGIVVQFNTGGVFVLDDDAVATLEQEGAYIHRQAPLQMTDWDEARCHSDPTGAAAEIARLRRELGYRNA